MNSENNGHATDKETLRLISYWLSRAIKSLDEAKILLENKYCNAYVNRLYYSCFYAATALLLSKNITTNNNSTMKDLFLEHFVDTGIIAEKYGAIFNQLYEKRIEADYGHFAKFKEHEVEELYVDAREFVDVINNFVRIAV